MTPIQRVVLLCLVSFEFIGLLAADTIPLTTRTKGAGDSLTDRGVTLPAPAPPQEGKSAKKADEKPDGPSPAFIASVDIFGTDRVTDTQIREFFGKELDTWIQAGMSGNPKAGDMEISLADKALKKFKFETAQWSIVQHFVPQGVAIHLTLDVVEPKDKATRANFLPDPKGEFADPEGLIKSWQTYENLALDLVEEGKLLPEVERCKAFHCPFGHKHASLAKYEPMFVGGLKRHHREISEILKSDRRPEYRAAAAFLLAYHTDGKALVEAMLERIRDSDVVVRNNVLRVLGDVAEFHRDLVIPIAPVLPALNFPRVSDRSKSLFVVHLLTEQSEKVRETVRATQVPQLLKLMANWQPDHRELAHNILRRLSGKDYAPNDMRSWERWARQVQKDRSVSKQK